MSAKEFIFVTLAVIVGLAVYGLVIKKLVEKIEDGLNEPEN